MSALTDLFTAMANKIRSKTGTATTYTPSEMVSDGIDDVFDAGVASVPTPTTFIPSNYSPLTMYKNNSYKPTGQNAVAVAGLTSVTPSNASPTEITSDDVYKATEAGWIIKSKTDITPSDSAPASLSSGKFYKPNVNGYAIRSYSTATPSDTSPASVSSGAIVKASSAGYLYKTLQTLTETSLWTNSSPTSTFAPQTVTLSQSSANFTYIKVYFRCSTSDSTTYDSGLIDIADYNASTGSSSAPRFAMSVAMTNAYARLFNKSTNTELVFGNARQWGQSTNVNTYCIPTRVVGVK